MSVYSRGIPDLSYLWQPAEDAWEPRGECARLVAEADPMDREYVASRWYPVHYYIAGTKSLSPEAAEAVEHCKRCDVQTECRLAGMSERNGIWGGLLPDERESLRRRAKRQALKQREAVKA